MGKNGLPEKQGLYNPEFEHDACGIGFVSNIKGKKSHEIIQQAIQILINLTHRGGSGSESNTGDGAGILIQIPHRFFKKECLKLNINLPEQYQYGVGMIFLPNEVKKSQDLEAYVNKVISDEGQTLLGWRDVPIDDSSLGKTAKSSMPCIKQIFIGRSPDISTDLDFERKLYVIRKLIEKYAAQKNEYFYAASLSCKTIVYKGMLTADQVNKFYKDLADKEAESALALVHSRYSTNTFPSWERAHPNRYIIHNGEINTLRGNVNWMNARQHLLRSNVFEKDLGKILPIIDSQGSDSSMFDNCLEFLTLEGRPITHAISMMVPEPWSNNKNMTAEKKAFYKYHSCLMEPWDGPAAIAFTDGTKIGAILDRNGLRPSRYYVTSDDLIIMSSEVGVLEVPPEKVICKERLHPGKMLLIDTEKGEIITDEEIKNALSKEFPYDEWLNKNMLKIEDLPQSSEEINIKEDDLITLQRAFGYNYEELKTLLAPMGQDGLEAIGAMGTDTPLAVLSQKPQLLYNYFKQLFAQVTNPPIDAIREEIVTSSEVLIGSEGNLTNPTPESCRQIIIKNPVINNSELEKLRNIKEYGFKSVTLPILFKSNSGGKGLENALEDLFIKANNAIKEGANIIILSDRDIDKDNVAIPALLAVSALHHHLIREGTRTKISLILESGEPREVHHFALLIGFGASAINPYLALETLNKLIEQKFIKNVDYKKAIYNYTKSSVKGIIKVISKMGISTIRSYHGSQIFEALGIAQSVIDKYFTSTPSRIGGIGIDIIAKEAQLRHDAAFNIKVNDIPALETGGDYQWRKNSEYHMFNPETIYFLQQACRNEDFGLFKKYSRLINEQAQGLCTLRGLMKLKTLNNPIPIDEVESVESICKRFKTGAMSYGSISQEAHEAIAIAMNRINGKSNSGEGGEDSARFIPLPNGDSKCSAIKQVASGRFGVTSHYLVNAKEIQIKMAQGAKPGEGGQLPAKKVYPWVARVRHSTAGVGLISPPPHHDIYSIEDLAELIHDLKNANSDARINVKLVSEVGVGTIAAGVAKGRADVVLISGYDGGTGASPKTSIKHAGLPWELGVAETHQTLLLNDLRSRIVIETDGKLLTGRDVAIAALLGAEEFGFATSVLIVMGCVMMRVCNLDTCPVGIATQNPELRKKFKGNPEHIVNFMTFIAEELREIMASLGFRTVNEMIGRTDKLDTIDVSKHWKASGLDLSNILYTPEVPDSVGRYCQIKQDHELEKSLDMKKLLDICKPALLNGTKVTATMPIKNTNRVVGTILGSEVSKKYGAQGLPDDTIELKFIGSAGQSFGAFVPKGISMTLEGDSNDYLGKGLCGGKIIVYPPKASKFAPEENIIVGNVAFYGATSGEAYINGIAGERFCVRNSGVRAVVEGVGDHGCEYMTGGRVVVLGSVGKNFAAGMSGGIAYVFDSDDSFEAKCNKEMVILEKVEEEDEINDLKAMISNHAEATGSYVAKNILKDWATSLDKFIKVMPKDYKHMLETIKHFEKQGLEGEDLLLAAFEMATNKK